MKVNNKGILIITFYCPPDGSAHGVYMVKNQMNLVDKKVKPIQTYRREYLKDITDYIANQKDINEILVAGDINQDVYSKEIESFLIANSLFNIHQFINETEQEDKTSAYLYGSKTIDLIAASSRLISFIDGCQLVDFNEIILTDHRRLFD